MVGEIYGKREYNNGMIFPQPVFLSSRALAPQNAISPPPPSSPGAISFSPSGFALPQKFPFPREAFPPKPTFCLKPTRDKDLDFHPNVVSRPLISCLTAILTPAVSRSVQSFVWGSPFVKIEIVLIPGWLLSQASHYQDMCTTLSKAGFSFCFKKM